MTRFNLTKIVITGSLVAVISSKAALASKLPTNTFGISWVDIHIPVEACDKMLQFIRNGNTTEFVDVPKTPDGKNYDLFTFANIGQEFNFPDFTNGFFRCEGAKEFLINGQYTFTPFSRITGYTDLNCPDVIPPTAPNIVGYFIGAASSRNYQGAGGAINAIKAGNFGITGFNKNYMTTGTSYTPPHTLGVFPRPPVAHLGNKYIVAGCGREYKENSSDSVKFPTNTIIIMPM